VGRARAALEALVPPGAVVITTPALGRPAENVTHYTHAAAYYEGEVIMPGTTLAAAVRSLLESGRRAYLLLPADDRTPLPPDRLTEVARRGGTDLYDWFVDPAHTPEAALFEVTKTPDG
jgi:hypothetical protein